jgi:hypothetical protein
LRQLAKNGRKTALFTLRNSSYRLGNAKETRSVKEFFIIVNRPLTITKPQHDERRLSGSPIMAGQLRPPCGPIRPIRTKAARDADAVT